MIVMCGSEPVRANWYKSTPRLFVIDPNVEFLQGLIDQQNEHIARYTDKGEKLPSHLFVNLILDDIALFDHIMSDNTFAQFVSCSRTLGIRIFVLAQYLIQIKKKNRTCFNGVAICGPQNPDGLKDLYKLYANFMPSKHHFIAAGMTFTKNRGLLMIDRKQQECFKLTMTWPFTSIPFGPPSQKKFSDDRLILFEIQRKKEAIQRQQERHEKEILTGSTNTNMLDINAWKRFVLENGKTIVFAPNQKKEEAKNPIEFFIDTTIDVDDWKSLQDYNIYYDPDKKSSESIKLHTEQISVNNLVRNAITITKNESDSESETSISDSDNSSDECTRR